MSLSSINKDGFLPFLPSVWMSLVFLPNRPARTFQAMLSGRSRQGHGSGEALCSLALLGVT